MPQTPDKPAPASNRRSRAARPAPVRAGRPGRRRTPPPASLPTAATAAGVSHVVFEAFSVGSCWAPPVNVYTLPDRIDVCVDLAGMDRRQIDVRVEPGQLVLRGVRRTPHPTQADAGVRIAAMEIDHGPFERRLDIPERVALARVTSRYEAGLLWITLPLLPPRRR